MSLPEKAPQPELSEKEMLRASYGEMRKMTFALLNKLNTAKLLVDEKDKYEADGNIVDVDTPNFEDWYSLLKRIKYGMGTGESTIRDSIGYGISLNIKKSTGDLTFKRITVLNRYRAIIKDHQYTGFDPSNSIVSVNYFENFQEPEGSQVFTNSSTVGGILFPQLDEIDETIAVSDFQELFSHSVSSPIILKEKTLPSHLAGRRPTKYHSLKCIDHNKRVEEENAKKEEFKSLQDEFKDLQLSNPFKDKSLKLGEISHNIGRTILRRYGLERKIDELKQQGKSVVYSSSNYGDIHAVSIRWDIGEFRDYAAKEVTIAVKPEESYLESLRKDEFKYGVAEVFIISAERNNKLIQIPIVSTNQTQEESYEFLKRHKTDKTNLENALNNALLTPRKALHISPGSIATTMSYIAPIIGAPRKQEKTQKPQKDIYESNSNNIENDEDDSRVNQQQEQEDEYQRQLEEDAMFEEEEMDNRISYGDAHGEVSWLDGRGEDEDGCEVYPSDN